MVDRISRSISTDAGRAGYDALLAEPRRALAAFDYDGTLAPIVEDPSTAVALPGIVDALAALAARIGRVAIVTGRPAGVAVELAGLQAVSGLESLVVLGQYGFERWTAETGQVASVEPPPALDRARREIPGVLAACGVRDAVIEDKGLALAVHVRRSAQPEAAFAAMRQPLTDLGEALGLAAEPGRLVLELRPPGMDKGKALLALAEELDAGTLVFCGDDLGDLAAFDAVEAWRAVGRPGLLVCSGSPEVTALADRADVVVEGPPGVRAFISEVTAALA
jgi:trehalose 6-phosphate phosphatase